MLETLFSAANLDPTTLHHGLLKAIDELGFREATPVQQETVPAVLTGKDLRVIAATGSGKTAAFLIPAIHHMLQNPDCTRGSQPCGTRTLILVPTRELAQQISKHCIELIKYTPLRCAVITGGESYKYQASVFRKNPEILIATPGRLIEHIENKTPDFSSLDFLVLDEADRMLDMGFGPDVNNIIQACNVARQTLLFSATLKQRGLVDLEKSALTNPENIVIETVRTQHKDITQKIILADDKKHKEKLLNWLIQNGEFKKILVFCNTRVQTDQLSSYLRYCNHKVGVLHGDMVYDDRKTMLNRYRNSHINILIASDLAARGLDIDDIDLVVNFDLPRMGDEYVHRIGRTGRAGQQGTAISLITEIDWNKMIGFQRYLRVEFERMDIPSLRGKFTEPKNVKKSGKIVGKKRDKKPVKTKKEKVKSPRQNKDKGAKKISTYSNSGDGMQPLKKKK